MIIMKKFMNAILVLVLVIGVVLSVGGCTKRDKNKSADSTQAVTTEATTTATTEAKNTKDNKSDNGKGKVKGDTVKTDSETVKANAAKTGKTEDDSNKEPATQAPATTEAPTTQAPAPTTQAPAPTTQAPATTEAPAPRTEEPTTAHQHTWKTVVDKDEWDEPIYEEQDVYEWHSMWPDGSYADNLTDPGAKVQWCIDHCTHCFPNCPDPDPAGRCALRITDGEVWVGTEKVQTGTRHHDAVTHQECSVCGARK